MKSRVHPKYKTKYRVGNWRTYERALIQRGDVTVWFSNDATDMWQPSPSGRPGEQQRFSDLAIETALTLQLVFRLPLRQTEGFLQSVLSLMDVDLEAPDHTLAGHADLSTTQRYMHLSPAAIEGVIRLLDAAGGGEIGETDQATNEMA